MKDTIEIVLEPFPEEGGQLVLVSVALARRFAQTTRAMAAEVRRASVDLLTAAASIQGTKPTGVTRIRIGTVDVVLLQSLVPFESRFYGVLCVVLPHEQRAGERAVATLVGEVRKYAERLS